MDEYLVSVVNEAHQIFGKYCYPNFLCNVIDL